MSCSRQKCAMMNWFDGVSKSTQSYSMHASAIRTPIDTNQDTNNFKLYCRTDGIRWLWLSPKKTWAIPSLYIELASLQLLQLAHSLRHVRPSGLLSAWAGSTFECLPQEQAVPTQVQPLWSPRLPPAISLSKAPNMGLRCSTPSTGG